MVCAYLEAARLLLRRAGVRLAVAFLPVLLLTSAVALASPTQDIVDQISQSSYTNYLSTQLYAHTGNNRGIAGTQHDLARTNIYNDFQSFGLTTSLDPLTYGGSTYYNVVGIHTGTVHPDQIYIVGAHYDSANNPGADDNASGVAGVLEAARVLSQYDFESTLIFIAFDREEQGLYGSTTYAGAHSTNNILGMVSLDMIAFNPTTNHDRARIYYATDNSPLTTALSTSLSTYGGITAAVGQMGRSDHQPFDDRGFNAALLIEYNWATNTNYHKSTDALETANHIDFDYATRMTQGTVGYLTDSAVLVIVPEPAGLCLIGVLILAARRRC